jgi:hypothetical protein
VPKPLPLPDDLIALQRAAHAAELAVAEYCALVQGRRRLEFPDDVVARCTWSEEETGELDRLREAYIAAALVVRAHPIWEQARTAAEPCHAQTWQALKDAAKAPVEV